MSNATKMIRKMFFPQHDIRVLRNELGKQREQIYVLRRQVEYITSYLPGYGDKVRELFVHLQPMKANEAGKVRIGAPIDGGYVMIDDFKGVAQAYSLGIGREASWDMDMAKRGIRVEQFDPTVTHAPERHALLHFQQRAVERISELCGNDGQRRILKIDIEGYEWEMFDAASEAELQQFDQIVGEFHRFDRFQDKNYFDRLERVFAKLNRTHQLIHIHGNNYSADFWTGKTYLAVDIELTFASRSRYTFSETKETFPGALDAPCDASKFDPPIDCRNV
jgi:hypothetical protein